MFYEQGINILKFDVVCVRGGFFWLIEGGIYEVNDDMIEDLKSGYVGQYVFNFGGIIV